MQDTNWNLNCLFEPMADLPAFGELTEGLSKEDLLYAAKTPSVFNHDLLERQEEIDKYSIPREQKTAFQKNMMNIRRELMATKKGTWLGIPRLWNSDDYNKALAAIEESTRCAGQADSGQVNMRSITTVKKYLSDKMDHRGREFGNVRFDECMKFLKAVMPEEEFKAYVDEVNTHREPQYKVSVDDFEPERNYNEILRDQKEKMTAPGYKPTERDVAKIIAAFQLVSENREKLRKDKGYEKDALEDTNIFDLDDKKLVKGRTLREETDRLLKNEGFREYIKMIGVKKAAEFAAKNPNKLILYGNEVLKAKARADHKEERKKEDPDLWAEGAAQLFADADRVANNELKAKKAALRADYKLLYKTMSEEQKQAAKAVKKDDKKLKEYMDNFKNTMTAEQKQSYEQLKAENQPQIVQNAEPQPEIIQNAEPQPEIKDSHNKIEKGKGPGLT